MHLEFVGSIDRKMLARNKKPTNLTISPKLSSSNTTITAAMQCHVQVFLNIDYLQCNQFYRRSQKSIGLAKEHANN